MLVSCETDIKTIENRIREMKDIENTVKERKKQMKKSVELLDGIIADGAISDTHLRMLVDEIVIYEKNGKLDIQIKNALMKHFYSIYDYSIQVTMGLVCEMQSAMVCILIKNYKRRKVWQYGGLVCIFVVCTQPN